MYFLFLFSSILMKLIKPEDKILVTQDLEEPLDSPLTRKSIRWLQALNTIPQLSQKLKLLLSSVYMLEELLKVLTH